MTEDINLPSSSSTFNECSCAADFLQNTLVWDSHGCMPLRPHDESFLPQLERYREAGVNIVFLNVGYGEDGIEQNVRMLALFRHWVRGHADKFTIIRTTEEVRAAQKGGKLAIAFNIEGMTAVADQPSMVELYYDLGVRWMLIAYNTNNTAGGGCKDVDTGLTPFGRQIIDEMERVGMLLCCSHTGRRTALEAMEYSSNPVIFSHSNSRTLWDHPRNIDDDLIRACAATGGVIGINGIGPFLGNDVNVTSAVVRHIDYVVNLVGPNHVGLGLDYIFDLEELPERIDLVAPEQLLDIVEQLFRLGYEERIIRRILGENFIRVAQAVWR